MKLPDIGLYRHFKGQYYYVSGFVKDCDTDEWMCTYYNVCHPSYGVFVRPCKEWFDNYTEKGAISERKDNVTGQSTRMVKVNDLSFQVKDISTEDLIRELQSRKDSPLYDLNIKEVEGDMFVREYCVGNKIEERYDPRSRKTYPRGVRKPIAFNTKEEAVGYYKNHKVAENDSYTLFRRTYLEEDVD